MTLNGVMAIILPYFTEFSSFRAHCIKVVEDIPKFSTIEIAILDLSKAISRKRCKIGGKLVLITNRKSYMSYRLGDLE